MISPRPRNCYVNERSKNLIWLDRNEVILDSHKAIHRKVLSEIDPLNICTYPDLYKCYHALSDYLDLPVENIFFTAGSDGAIKLCYEVLLEHNDFVLRTEPTYGMYPIYAEQNNVQEVICNYRRSDTSIYLDVDEFISLMRKHTPKLVCIPTPDSPTGALLAENDIKHIIDVAKELSIYLLIDEAYYPISEFTSIKFLNQYEKIIIIRTFNKAWACAGLRIGYAIAAPGIIDKFNDVRAMREIGGFESEFVRHLLSYKNEIMESIFKLRDNKIYFEESLSSLGYETLNTAANFSLVDFGNDKSFLESEISNHFIYRTNFQHPSMINLTRFTISDKSKMEYLINLITRICN